MVSSPSTPRLRSCGTFLAEGGLIATACAADRRVASRLNSLPSRAGGASRRGTRPGNGHLWHLWEQRSLGAVGFSQAHVGVGAGGGNPTSGSPLDKTLLEEEGLVGILHCLGLFADGDGQG